MKIIDTIFEIIGWLQIVLGATLAAGIIAFITYLNWSTETGKIVAIIIISIGFILGYYLGHANLEKARNNCLAFNN